MTPNDAFERHLAEGLTNLAATGNANYLDDVLGRSVRTRQRRAWPFQRSVFPARAPQERVGRPTWRFQDMNIVLRYTVVTALVLTLGIGLAPIIGSHGQNATAPSLSPSPLPSADPMAPALVTGTLVLAYSCTGPTTTIANGVQHDRGARCEPQTWTTSDARLSGTAVSTWNQDVYGAFGKDRFIISNGVYDIHNDGGSWRCVADASFNPNSDSATSGPEAERTVCVGAGGYTGLSAVVVLDWVKDPVSLTGAIFPGQIHRCPDARRLETGLLRLGGASVCRRVDHQPRAQPRPRRSSGTSGAQESMTCPSPWSRANDSTSRKRLALAAGSKVASCAAKRGSNSSADHTGPGNGKCASSQPSHLLNGRTRRSIAKRVVSSGAMDSMASRWASVSRPARRFFSARWYELM